MEDCLIAVDVHDADSIDELMEHRETGNENCPCDFKCKESYNCHCDSPLCICVQRKSCDYYS